MEGYAAPSSSSSSSPSEDDSPEELEAKRWKGDSMDDDDDGEVPPDLVTWRQVHALLLRAVEAAETAVAQKKAERRYWMEELAFNLSETGGRLEPQSSWKRPVAIKFPKSATTTSASSSSKAAAGGGKRKKKEGKTEASSPDAVPSKKKPRKNKGTARTASPGHDSQETPHMVPSRRMSASSSGMEEVDDEGEIYPQHAPSSFSSSPSQPQAYQDQPYIETATPQQQSYTLSPPSTWGTTATTPVDNPASALHMMAAAAVAYGGYPGIATAQQRQQPFLQNNFPQAQQRTTTTYASLQDIGSDSDESEEDPF